MAEEKKVVNFRLDEDVARRFKARTALDGRSVQDFLEEAVMAYIEGASDPLSDPRVKETWSEPATPRKGAGNGHVVTPAKKAK